MRPYSIRNLVVQDGVGKTFSAGEDFELILMLGGEASVTGCGQTSPISQNYLLLLQPGNEIQVDYAPMRCECCILRFSPVLLDELSDAQTNLTAAFSVVPLPWTAERVSPRDFMLIKSLTRRLASLASDPPQFGDAIYEDGLLKMLVVQILRSFIAAEHHLSGEARHHLLMDEIFSYLHTHIEEELTLDELAAHFYVSKYHLSREFRRQTGETLHAYIIKAKLGLCCAYIEKGYPITEVYKIGGFGGYNHFFRAFRKVYGMTPKEYYHATRAGARA